MFNSSNRKQLNDINIALNTCLGFLSYEFMPKKNNFQQMLFMTDYGPVAFLLKRSSRRKTLEVQVKDDGHVFVSAPNRISEEDLNGFIQQRALWIKKHSFKRKVQFDRSQKHYRHGAMFLFLGRKFPLRVKVVQRKFIKIDFIEDHWVVFCPKDIEENKSKIKNKLWVWYKEQAKEVFGVRVLHYARLMQEDPEKILIRKQKRIWGCCDKTRKVISLNWQLIQAPLWVIDYVIVHELAHLKHANHSTRFWNRVSRFYPNYSEAKNWLAANQVEITLV